MSSPRRRDNVEAAPQQEPKRQKTDTDRCKEPLSTITTVQWWSERESGEENVPGVPEGPIRPNAMYWPTDKENMTPRLPQMGPWEDLKWYIQREERYPLTGRITDILRPVDQFPDERGVPLSGPFMGGLPLKWRLKMSPYVKFREVSGTWFWQETGKEPPTLER